MSEPTSAIRSRRHDPSEHEAEQGHTAREIDGRSLRRSLPRSLSWSSLRSHAETTTPPRPHPRIPKHHRPPRLQTSWRRQQNRRRPTVRVTRPPRCPPETDENEFIDLSFLSAFSNVEISIQPAEECDNSDPDLLVCEFEQAGDLQATHLGLARDTESGTMTTYLEESCTGPGGAVGNPVVWEATGQMATPMGDVANFRLRNNQCNADARATMRAYWVIDGGTGRFADAYGLMSVMPWPGETLTVSTGTLSVRADLWQDTLPPHG